MSTQVTKVKPIDEVRNALVKMEPQFKAALPSHVSVEKFTRVVMTAVQQAPNLLDLDRTSLFSACVTAAQSGLLPDGREGAIVPFKDKAKWMPMTAGILKMVRNSGELLSLSSAVVYQNDEFDYWTDENGEHLKHKPTFEKRGEPRLVFAIAKTKDGGVYMEVMTSEEIEKVRNSSRAKNSGPWTDWWGEMSRKTVIRRLSKRLPMSTDLDTIIRSEDEDYAFEQPEKQESQKTSSRLATVVASTKNAQQSNATEGVHILTQTPNRQEQEAPI